MDPRLYYDEVIQRLELEVATLKKQDVFLAIARGVAMLSSLGSFYGYFITSSTLFLYAGGILLVVFAVVLRKHMSVREVLNHLRTKLDIASNEHGYLDGELSPFDQGTEYRDEAHPYANDLDVFGKGSLYQRLARCKTKGGRDTIADELCDLKWQDLNDRQRAVQELSEHPDQLMEFRTILEQLNQQDIKGRVEHWVNDQKEGPILFKRPFILSFGALLPLGILTILITGEWDWLGVLSYIFILNLIVLGQGAGFLRKQYQQLDRIHKDTKIYGRLIQEFRSWNVKSPALNALLERFESEGEKADEQLRIVGKILGRFDTMNNIVVLVVLNGAFLFHVHVSNALMSWKRKHAHLMVDWLKALEELETWVSKGQFHFNHPTYSFPQLVEGSHFDAKAIGHPFLDALKRVDNDIQFDDFRIIVLTGSNMAGKSTFLRSIGVNMILAAIGLPVCAENMKLSPFQLLSSMKPQDSINDDRSYFQAEVLRLRMILDRIDLAQPSFVLFDEILRGTNSDDKRNGTRAFLDGLVDKNLLGVIATHDIEIADSSGRDAAVFKNYFFESTFSEGEIHFDYRLREGVCRTPNATQLLKKYGVI